MALYSPRQRTLAKCVDVKRVRDWAPEPRRIDLAEAWTIIKNHYCAALVARGVCPVECEDCRGAIVSMFDDFDDARNPEALLTYRAKDRSARRIESLIAAQKREVFPALETRDPIGALFHKKQPENLFLELLKDYE